MKIAICAILLSCLLQSVQSAQGDPGLDGMECYSELKKVVNPDNQNPTGECPRCKDLVVRKDFLHKLTYKDDVDAAFADESPDDAVKRDADDEKAREAHLQCASCMIEFGMYIDLQGAVATEKILADWGKRECGACYLSQFGHELALAQREDDEKKLQSAMLRVVSQSCLFNLGKVITDAQDNLDSPVELSALNSAWDDGQCERYYKQVSGLHACKGHVLFGPSKEAHVIAEPEPEAAEVVATAEPTIECYNLYVLNAEGLPAMDSWVMGGKTDAYVIIKSMRGPFVAKSTTTPTVKNDLKPKWNQRFKIPGNAEKLKFEVFDWDRITSDDPIGQAQLELGDFSRWSKQCLNLEPMEGSDPKGAKLCVQIKAVQKIDDCHFDD